MRTAWLWFWKQRWQDGAGKSMREIQRRKAARGRIFLTLGSIAALACLSTLSSCRRTRDPQQRFRPACDHHAMVDGRMRLYISAGEDSYIEFARRRSLHSSKCPIRRRTARLRLPPSPNAGKADRRRPARDARASRSGAQPGCGSAGQRGEGRERRQRPRREPRRSARA
jgi:hypothetical protein